MKTTVTMTREEAQEWIRTALITQGSTLANGGDVEVVIPEPGQPLLNTSRKILAIKFLRDLIATESNLIESRQQSQSMGGTKSGRYIGLANAKSLVECLFDIATTGEIRRGIDLR